MRGGCCRYLYGCEENEGCLFLFVVLFYFILNFFFFCIEWLSVEDWWTV